MFTSLSQMVGNLQVDVLARDLAELEIEKAHVQEGPRRSDSAVLPVWTFGIEAQAVGQGLDLVHRTLEDVAWVRRALLYAVPGVFCPPAPLANHAASRHSSASGNLPSVDEEGAVLRATLQVFLDRCLANPELRDEDLLKSFLLDETEVWAKRKAEEALRVAPAQVVVGAMWQGVEESLGFTESTGYVEKHMVAVYMTGEDRTVQKAMDDYQAWVVNKDRQADAVERAARAEAVMSEKRAIAVGATMDVLATLTDSNAAANNAVHRLANVTKARAPVVALLGELADMRALLKAAQESLNMRELCRRECATARRKLKENVASCQDGRLTMEKATRQSNEAKDLGAKEDASFTDTFRKISLDTQSAIGGAMLGTYYATEKQLTESAVVHMELRRRAEVASARVTAQCDWLQASWPFRAARALEYYARIEHAEKDETSATVGTVAAAAAALALEEPGLDWEKYSPPNYASIREKAAATALEDQQDLGVIVGDASSNPETGTSEKPAPENQGAREEAAPPDPPSPQAMPSVSV